MFTDKHSGKQYIQWCLWMIDKRGRKYGVRFKVATQQVADVLRAGRHMEALISNADTKVLGKQLENDLADLQKLIGRSNSRPQVEPRAEQA